jgi:hypothetical protein
MKKVLAAATVFAGLALAQGAFAAPNSASISVAYVPPKLNTSTQTEITVDVAQSSDPIAAITIYSGTDTAALTAAAGTQIGTVDAVAVAHEQGGLTLPLNGTVVADDPAKHTADPCSPGANAAVWNMSLSAVGQTLTIPIYVNRTTGAEAALGVTKLTICLTPYDVPQAKGGAPFGAQLIHAGLTLNNIFTSRVATGQTVWEALFTPYTPGTLVPNRAGTWEARALTPLPVVLSIKARYVKKTNTWKLSGTLTEGGKGVAGAAIHLARGLGASNLSTRSSTKTSGTGAWSTAGHLKPNKPTYFQASAAPQPRSRDATAAGCQQPNVAIAPAGCTSATLPMWSVKSVVVRIKP